MSAIDLSHPESIPAVITVKQYAEATQTNLRTVTKMCTEGRLHAKKLPDTNTWRISGDDLRQWFLSLQNGKGGK